MTDNNAMEIQVASGEELVEANDQTMIENAMKSVTGRSETAQIIDKSFEDDTTEMNEMEMNKINDDMVKKLLICDKIEQKNDKSENEESLPKTSEELEEAELLREIAKRPLESFKNMKDIPDAIAKIYYKDIVRRWKESEVRIKETENLLLSVKYEDRSLEEDRLEILGELLDKATQSFEIFEEHENRKVPYGHRIVLESRLLIVFNNAINIIYKIIGEFDKLRDDQIGVNDERDQLRYEIRYCDAVYTEVHERFLKSYLEMEW
ncbi:hypothetical protein DINM_020249 [Dirofilaria immitis]|nr:hypothetical protein [Dirofilaria immitis]